VAPGGAMPAMGIYVVVALLELLVFASDESPLCPSGPSFTPGATSDGASRDVILDEIKVNIQLRQIAAAPCRVDQPH
jgi:hypothetical protein